MVTATGYIPNGGNWPTGSLLYTHPSGMYSNITKLMFNEYGTNAANVEIIEVYPTGNIPSFSEIKSGVILKTKSNNTNLTNIHIPTTSKHGSQVRVVSSGQLDIYCNYQLLGQPLKRVLGYNSWNKIIK